MEKIRKETTALGGWVRELSKNKIEYELNWSIVVNINKVNLKDVIYVHLNPTT